jgi:hypothetical protein
MRGLISFGKEFAIVIPTKTMAVWGESLAFIISPNDFMLGIIFL